MIGLGIVLGLVSAKKLHYETNRLLKTNRKEHFNNAFIALATFVFCCLVVHMEVSR